MPSRRTSRLLHLFGVAVGALSTLLGCVVLVGGWGFGLASLRSLVPGLSTMKANTAIGVAALGLSVAFTGRTGHLRVIGRVAAALALVLGVLTLAEYVFHWNAGIDQLLFSDPATPQAAFPGRPAIATALMIVLLGVAQSSANLPALRVVRSAAALAVSLIAWAALNGYVFGAEALRAVPLFSSVALHTAIAILLLSVGVLAVEPTSWPMRTAFARGSGGTVCRWLLPPAIVAPPLLGWLLNRAGLVAAYPDPFRWALYTAVSSLGSVWLILMLAHRIALIDAERALATQLSLHDAMTGLANRRAFDSFLAEGFGLAKRHGHALSLMLLDIDRFKSYNDDYGHPAGDELLKKLGVLIASLARETDLVARIGGEEFAVALPETDLAGARVIAERVRAAVEHSQLFRRAVTVSIGIAAMSDTTADPANLIQDCDALLYRAKAAGRNRVASTAEAADPSGTAAEPSLPGTALGHVAGATRVTT